MNLQQNTELIGKLIEASKSSIGGPAAFAINLPSMYEDMVGPSLEMPNLQKYFIPIPPPPMPIGPDGQPTSTSPNGNADGQMPPPSTSNTQGSPVGQQPSIEQTHLPDISSVRSAAQQNAPQPAKR